ncbi:Conserved_hypothetical protein [Hexamita inflata]|uniref:Uncharacterized protein n=1 Tax=Hexamita inflata TaxID=28002 RepID=A0AA86UN99_9EUKA|nr:Conserved hypothetical protein [Hexamita inflata]
MSSAFTEFAQQIRDDIEEDMFTKFSQQPNVIQIISQTKANLIQSMIPDLAQQPSVTLLQSEEEVFAACCVVYYYSVDISMDLLENYDLYRYSVHLSKLLFQQEKVNLPLSFYSAFSVIVLRFLECIELKKSDDIQLLNQCLKQLNFNFAFDDLEASKMMCTLLRDIGARFYQTINTFTIEFLVSFLDLQKDVSKLIELFSLKYFTPRFGKNEQKLAELSFQAFCNQKFDEEDMSPEERVQLHAQTILQQISSTVSQLQEQAVNEYLLPYLIKNQKSQIHLLIIALVNTKLSQYKTLAVITAECLFKKMIKTKLDFPNKHIFAILEALLVQLMSCDEAYFIQLILFTEEILNTKTNFLSNTGLVAQIGAASPAAALDVSQMGGELNITNVSLIQNIANLPETTQKQLYIYLLVFYTILPPLLYISILKLSTHNGFVSSQIQVRKAVVEFYGELILNKEVIDSLVILSGTGSGQNQKKVNQYENKSGVHKDILNEINAERSVIHNKHEEFTKLFYDFINRTKFKHRSVSEILREIFGKIQNLLGKDCNLKDFILQEILFRLQDESQQVKKLASLQIKNLVNFNYEYVGLIFTDVLQMQNQDQYLIQIFDEYILTPIYDNGLQLQNLFKFLENCPLKLFESTFADFLKERELDFQIILNLLKFNRVGSMVALYYIVNYSQVMQKQKRLQIINSLQQYLLLNIDRNPEINVYILNVLTTDQLLDHVDFDLSVYISNVITNNDVAELMNKITATLVVKSLEPTEQAHSDLINSIKSSLQQQIKQMNQSQTESEQTSKLLIHISFLAQKHQLTQENMMELTHLILKLLVVHPMASHPLLFFMYESKNIEFRLNIFDILVQQLNETNCIRSANNIMLAILSSIYAYPDELGQFIGLMLDNTFLRNSYIVQRHFLSFTIQKDYVQQNLVTKYLYSYSCFQFLQIQIYKHQLKDYSYQPHIMQLILYKISQDVWRQCITNMSMKNNVRCCMQKFFISYHKPININCQIFYQKKQAIYQLTIHLIQLGTLKIQWELFNLELLKLLCRKNGEKQIKSLKNLMFNIQFRMYYQSYLKHYNVSIKINQKTYNIKLFQLQEQCAVK